MHRAPGRLPRRYCGACTPLVSLIQELEKHRQVRYVHVRRGRDTLTVRNRASA